LIALLGAIAYVISYYHTVRKYPKGPLPLPLIGNLYHLTPDGICDYIREVEKDYGPCFTLFMPRPVVIFNDFATIKEAMVTQGENFAGRGHLPPENYLQKVEQTGLIYSDGEEWRVQKRASLRILRDLGLGKNLMEAQVNRSIDEMLDQIKATNDEVTPFDMNLPIQLCVGNIINETLFGYHFHYSDTTKFEFFVGCINRHFQYLKDNFWVQIIQGWPWTAKLPIIGRKGYTEPMENIAKYHAFVDAEVDKVARAFETTQEPSNFVQSYLVEMEKDRQLDMDNLRAIVVDFWLAGMETTGTTLRWALLLLMNNIDAQDKMRGELLSVVGKERRVEMADKPCLPYFNAAIAEIQRLANIVTFTDYHRCTEDSMVAGHLILKGTMTLPQLYSVLKDERVFKNPEMFQPERFLEKDGKTASKNALDHMVAFGMGKRQCIGEGLARVELFLVLGNLLLNYRFEPTQQINLKPIFSAVVVPRPYKCRVVSL
ncbi:hypothetical protein PENTCL1PPCAC_14659, partial [Pristionchus entomophagus]